MLEYRLVKQNYMMMENTIIEMRAQGARINTKSNLSLSPITDIDMLQRMGFLSIHMSIAHATLHVISCVLLSRKTELCIHHTFHFESNLSGLDHTICILFLLAVEF